jgi:hypothetical protein
VTRHVASDTTTRADAAPYISLQTAEAISMPELTLEDRIAGCLLAGAVGETADAFARTSLAQSRS